MTEVTLRDAQLIDAPALAALFDEAFGSSISHLFPDGVPREILVYLMRFMIRHLPDACHVALRVDEDGSQIVVGYCLAPKSMPRLWWRALGSADLWALVGKVVRREFPLRLGQLRRLIGNKFSFFRSFQVSHYHSGAQILSVAVSSEARGWGIGTQLVERALQRLKEHDVETVKLEVRPDNQAAKKLYYRLGFRPLGSTQDSQGDWLVMILDFSESHDEVSSVE